MTHIDRKKLIEVALPLKTLNAAADVSGRLARPKAPR